MTAWALQSLPDFVDLEFARRLDTKVVLTRQWPKRRTPEDTSYGH